MIDRAMHAVGFFSGLKLQNSFGDRETSVWRNNMDLIRLYAHVVRYFAHRHCRRFREQFGKGTLMDGIEMLNQHKGHSGIQPAGVSATGCNSFTAGIERRRRLVDLRPPHGS